MNIFWLDEDMTRCAEYHCDKHVVKMLLESVQILSTVLHANRFVSYVDGDGITHLSETDRYYDAESMESFIPYKPTHPNHPCVVWAGMCTGNFKKLTLLATKLSNEYTYRYGRRHKSADALRTILQLTNMNTELPLDYHIESIPPQCVGEDLMDPSADVVSVYRKYYRQKELDGMDMRWTKRDRPEFMQ